MCFRCAGARPFWSMRPRSNKGGSALSARCPDSGTTLLRVGGKNCFRLIDWADAPKTRVPRNVPDSTDLDRTGSNS